MRLTGLRLAVGLTDHTVSGAFGSQYRRRRGKKTCSIRVGTATDLAGSSRRGSVMTDHIIDGRVTSRQHLLQLLRGVCTGAAALSERELLASGQWEGRAKAAYQACATLQRGLIASHPKLADQLHMLATEIQIALAAQTHNDLFASRIEKIRAAIRRVEQTGLDVDRSA